MFTTLGVVVFITELASVKRIGGSRDDSRLILFCSVIKSTDGSCGVAESSAI